MPESHAQQAPERRVVGERWELVEPLAEGGMGAVWVARHLVTGRRAALKLLDRVDADASLVERFRREAAVTTGLGHPGIVEVLDAGLDAQAETFFIAMELLVGATLQDKLEDPRSTPAHMLSLIHRALAPLAAAHGRGVIHRDLKPANIFIVEDELGERPKLLDFGIAKQSGNSRMTATGTAMGTPYYMSPEQALDARRVSTASDVWAVGVMIYEAVTGEVPFDGSTPHGVIVAACTEPHVPLLERHPETDPALSALVDRCLAKDPTERPADATQLAEALAPLVRDSAVPQARVPSRAPALGDPRESSRVRERVPIEPEREVVHQVAPVDPASAVTGLVGAVCVGGASFLAAADASLSVPILGAGALGVGLVCTAFVLAKRASSRHLAAALDAAQRDQPMPERATLRPPARGSAGADVTLLAFVNPRGQSGRDATVLLDSLALRYDDDLRIICHDLPLDEPSTLLAEAALEGLAQAGEPAWRAMREAWLEGPQRVTLDRVIEVGRALGLDAHGLRAALRDHRHRRTLDTARELAKSLGVQQAPTFFIDGERIEASQKLSDFTTIIDRHLGLQVSPTVREMTAQTLPKIALSKVGLRDLVVSWRGARGATLRVVRNQRDALDRARKVRERATMADTDFAKLARRFGDADAELGVVSPIDLPSAIRDAAERLECGQISDVIEADDGYHILLRYC